MPAFLKVLDLATLFLPSTSGLGNPVTKGINADAVKTTSASPGTPWSLPDATGIQSMFGRILPRFICHINRDEGWDRSMHTFFENRDHAPVWEGKRSDGLMWCRRRW